ncbi:MAG: response regulator [Asticcacaulis sp.]|nr:response regulator [Asticcacaulis sp.]
MMDDPRARPIHRVLLVEDNRGDAILLRGAVERQSTALAIDIAPSAEDALSQLHDCLLAPETLPNALIVDINLPGMSGIEFLGRYKADDRLRFLPAIVMSSSRSSRDVRQAYDHYAAGFIAKPTDTGNYDHIANCLVTCWLSLMELPVGNKLKA